MNNQLSPIILFTYNRPWHTQQTLEALEKNDLAQESVLYIYADGVKENSTEEQIQKIQEVRTLIRKDWSFKEIHIVEREKNWGLADNIVDGVTEIVNKYGKIIVLEDDIVTSIGFLKYMNEALELYEGEEKVMHVSGYIPALGNELPDTYFYNQTSCWGWATWKEAWESIDLDAKKLLKEIIQKDRLFEFDLAGSYPFSGHLRANINGKMKTWAVKWHASVFLKKGLCLHPKFSLVKNIGNDNSGTNSGLSNVYDTSSHTLEILVKKIDLQENQSVRKKMIDFNYKSSFKAKPISPLTKTDNVQQIKSIPTQKLIESYQKSFDLDVSRFFEGIPEIRVFECLDTGYQFYYPFNIDGDGKFYEHLQQYDWYYMPWKWEHQQTAKLLKSGMEVLEVGCAKGDFLAKIKQDYQVNVTGLELNEDAVKEAQSKGLNVLKEMVQEHSETHQEKYDLVCSFQVLEHIADIQSFLEVKIKCLKKGGKLVIAVPNNDSFIKYDFDNNILNMPPHHMGLWGKKSLRVLEKYYDIVFDKFLFEPIQEYHQDWYKSSIKKRFHEYRKRRRYQIIYNKMPRFIQWRMDYYGEKMMKRFSNKDGHTILVIYTKK